MIKMNKEIEDALHTLLHCSLKDTEYETQVEQYKLVRDYITNLKKENKQLNSLVNSCQEEIRRLKKQLEEYKATNEVLSHELTKDKVLQQDCLTTCCGIPIGDIPKLITQQKEFINYLEDEFTKIQNDIEKEIDNNVKYFKVERRQIITEILQKYKSIIGDDK